MKLWIVSDLHTDHAPWLPAVIPDHDLLIIAGDISDRPDDALVELSRLRDRIGTRIIFTPGNHDLFTGELDDLDEVDLPGIDVLSCGQSIVIDGVRFVGATLWTDWHLVDAEWASQSAAARNMPEYQYVRRPDGDLIWPIHTAEAHDVHRAAIEAILRTPHFGETVVVTHHAPSPRSIRGRPQPEDAAFASNLEDMIWSWQPELWVHGHVHHASDYRIGSTRVLCNPRGYVTPGWDEKTGWQEDLVIDV